MIALNLILLCGLYKFPVISEQGSENLKIFVNF